MTKGEKLEIDEMWEEVNNAYKGLGPRATSFLVNSVKTHKFGVVEAVDWFLKTLQIHEFIQGDRTKKKILNIQGIGSNCKLLSPKFRSVWYPLGS